MTLYGNLASFRFHPRKDGGVPHDLVLPSGNIQHTHRNPDGSFTLIIKVTDPALYALTDLVRASSVTHA